MAIENQGVLRRDLPDYTVESILGRGATSTVYRATQNTLGRYVAIKRLAPEVFLPEEVAQRFEREAAMWAHFRHENLIHLYDYRVADGTRYIILEYCDGIELRELIKQTLTLPPRIAAAIGIQALAALEYLHRYGIVHRDFKPTNVFVTTDGVVKLMDFGISLCPELEPMTKPGQILGTPAYMSPEQAGGKEVGPASDLFSFGVVLFELLEGCTPFRAATIEQAIEELARGKFAKPSGKLPRPLRKLMKRCLVKNTKKRISSATEAIALLERYLTSLSSHHEHEVVRRYLLERGLVRDEPRLFPENVAQSTGRGPLAATFSLVSREMHTQARRTRRRRIFWIVLALALLAAVYFGPAALRPDWRVLWHFLESLFR